MKDSKFVSSQPHEIETIAKKYEAPKPLVYYIQHIMVSNFGATRAGKFIPGKVLRSKMYEALEAMGFKDEGVYNKQV